MSAEDRMSAVSNYIRRVIREEIESAFAARFPAVHLSGDVPQILDLRIVTNEGDRGGCAQADREGSGTARVLEGKPSDVVESNLVDLVHDVFAIPGGQTVRDDRSCIGHGPSGHETSPTCSGSATAIADASKGTVGEPVGGASVPPGAPSTTSEGGAK